MQASHRGGFPCCGARRALGLGGSSSVVLTYRLSYSVARGIFQVQFRSVLLGHRPGIKPVFPALAGRFFTIEPPGKPQDLHFRPSLPTSGLHGVKLGFRGLEGFESLG